jgi:hypothetical protein
LHSAFVAQRTLFWIMTAAKTLWGVWGGVVGALVLLLMLLGLPLLGVWAARLPVGDYLQFPPLTRVVAPAPFQPVVFWAMALGILAVVGLIVRRGVGGFRGVGRVVAVGRFRWWGWVGVVLLGGAWVLAWSRYHWAAPMQMHTFAPLWMAYILVVNGLAFRQRGRCLLTHRPGLFLALFPASAVFWWFFEYLNRFVANWHYTGPVQGMDPWSYVVFATIPFATVLPAVLGTAEWLGSHPGFDAAFRSWVRLPWLRRRGVLLGMLAAAAIGLVGIGWWPRLLFPLLWVAPLVIVLAVQGLRGRRTLLDELAAGDWRRAVIAALAALVCGGLWEMWNMYSLARWEYAVPFVHTFQIFEMPVLGYAGYLPFGLECLAIGDILAGDRPHLCTPARATEPARENVFDRNPAAGHNEPPAFEGSGRRAGPISVERGAVRS